MADNGNNSGLRFDKTIGFGSVLNLITIIGGALGLLWAASGQFSELKGTVNRLDDKIVSAVRELAQKIDLTTQRLDQRDLAHDGAINRLERAYERSRTRGIEP